MHVACHDEIESRDGESLQGGLSRDRERSSSASKLKLNSITTRGELGQWAERGELETGRGEQRKLYNKGTNRHLNNEYN